MLGDVLLNAEKHERAARQIVDKLLTEDLRKCIVTVGGESGSGKSELAHLVAKYLKDIGHRAKILHTDNYYRTPPEERMAQRERDGFETVGSEEYDWPMLDRHIDDFKNDRTAIMPCVDILTDQVDMLRTDFSVIDVLVLEGLYATKASADVRVFIDLTYEETKKAQLLRGKEPQNALRMKVLEAEHRAVQELRPLADLIVDKAYVVVDADLNRQEKSE
jgi:uridine kinase